jgi:hypothetical protein
MGSPLLHYINPPYFLDRTGTRNTRISIRISQIPVAILISKGFLKQRDARSRRPVLSTQEKAMTVM